MRPSSRLSSSNDPSNALQNPSILSPSDCNTLYPSAARLSAHQTAAHLPGVLRESITWFDPAAEQAEEEAERERKAEKDREAARRSFMPLP